MIIFASKLLKSVTWREAGRLAVFINNEFGQFIFPKANSFFKNSVYIFKMRCIFLIITGVLGK
jgi:hypothetical protein